MIKEDLQTFSDDTIIWRYLSIFKFFDVLKNQRLFFTRSDKFEDKFEGSLFEDYQVDLLKIIPDLSDEMLTDFSSFSLNQKRNYFINCWTTTDDESIALWKLYANKDLCIRSTIGLLKKSLLEQEKYTVHICQVKYENYKEHTFDPRYMIQRLQRKDISYAYENEVRFIIEGQEYNSPMPKLKYLDLPRPLKATENGLSIPIIVDTLVDAVFISPFVSEQENSVIKSLIKDHDILNQTQFLLKICESRLSRHPIY